jgi:hypothetical protein
MGYHRGAVSAVVSWSIFSAEGNPQNCKESFSDNIWWHQPWRQGVPRSATLEEEGGGGGVDSTSLLT